ncbi:hypothetical protein Y032_0238g3288 [Ancylostoma ceylanicum]|uniref:Kelch repeat protein n=2 Tax=Ancylostoma ceylanicum TaxID=53326 RepID=A0A016SFB5_9BILA|nr:hypothetical protein Y032_0238g3288 [Ancylostoma ceylanicum]
MSFWSKMQIVVVPCKGLDIEEIYVIGGRSGKGYLNSVEYYDVARKEWIEVAPMRAGRQGSAAVFFDNMLYVCGGDVDGSRSSYPVEVYDPRTNTWRDGVPMTESYSNAVAVVIEGYIYVMGLYLSSLFCERLSPALGFWERVSAMENSHEYIALTTTQGRVYACRRCEPLAAGCKLDCFDLRTMAWTTVASLPICPQVPSLVSHGSEIFIIGGSREDSRRVMVFREGTNACSVEYSPKAGELLGIETTALASKLH